MFPTDWLQPADPVKRLVKLLAEEADPHRAIALVAADAGLLRVVKLVYEKQPDRGWLGHHRLTALCRKYRVLPDYFQDFVSLIAYALQLIPPEDEYYEVLGIGKTASREDIKRAFRRLSLVWHPDKNPNDAEAAEGFQRIRRAYAALSDENARRRYDARGTVFSRLEQDLPGKSGRAALTRRLLRSFMMPLGVLLGVLLVMTLVVERGAWYELRWPWGGAIVRQDFLRRPVPRDALHRAAGNLARSGDQGQIIAEEPSEPITALATTQGRDEDEPPSSVLQPLSSREESMTAAGFVLEGKRIADGWLSHGTQTAGPIGAEAGARPADGKRRRPDPRLSVNDSESAAPATRPGTDGTPSTGHHPAKGGQDEQPEATVVRSDSANGKPLPLVQKRIADFLHRYSRAHELQDLTTLADCYELEALERGEPLTRLISSGLPDHEGLHGGRWLISLKNWSPLPNGGVEMRGDLRLQLYAPTGAPREVVGLIRLTLIPYGDTFRIRHLEFSRKAANEGTG